MVASAESKGDTDRITAPSTHARTLVTSYLPCVQTLGSEAGAQSRKERVPLAYSTTLGTTKKLSSLAGALARIFSG